MENSKQTPFYIALISCFLAASSLLKAPFYKKSVTPIVVSFVAAILIFIGFYYVCDFVLSRKTNKNIQRIISIIFAAAEVVVAAFAFMEYTEFIYSAVLLRASKLLIKAVFAFCVFCVSISKKEGLYKFAFLSVLLASAVFIIMFLLSVKNFDIRNLSGIIQLKYFSLKQTGVYLLKMFLPALAAVLFIVKNERQPVALPILSGVVFGGVIIAVTLLDSILTFGLPLAAKLTYPYLSDISTVTVGNLFTRMDGFAYFAFFACYIVKCGVCINLSATLVSEKYKKILCLLLSAALVIF